MNELSPVPRLFLQALLSPEHAWAAAVCRVWPDGGNAASGAANASSAPPAVAAPLAALADSLGRSTGIKALTKAMPLFLPVTTEDLGDPALSRSLPAQQSVFVLPAAALSSPKAIASCAALRQRGYHCGLRIDRKDLIAQVPVDAFDWLQLDATFARTELPVLELIRAHQSGLQMMATGVGTRTLAEWLKEKHFALHDGRFVALLDRQRRREADIARLKLVKLLGLVIADADTREIEAIFREEARLSYNLLRLVNSVAVGARTKIVSFRQAIDVLGRRQLKRWLQLLIYANPIGNGEPNPLLTLAAARGRALEAMCEKLPAPEGIENLSDAAFTVGIFSLLDVLLNLPLAEITAALPLHESISAALVERRGMLGELLAAQIASESGHDQLAAAALDRLGIAPALHLDAQATAVHWAAEIARQPLE
ncbi:EAL and HDOD domain-containing protein [Rhodocyclus tenuis]|uniref:EAL and modified HD-GYP domain-containing signal transduction protein n=1 Tax=Rhodocyclus tenuis TaxID=1066 RepID=A0A840GGN1_RHOTE|nr:HDOD domain-containing protein [Rhodocyclus tenuis]MBB4247662.1 EAL and modified HD-GYP domain-containing signal transduction protein [Rhodocyclus tenuis]MBK1679736.1 hypothetical protein [Rhodocyclus tenuis]